MYFSATLPVSAGSRHRNGLVFIKNGSPFVQKSYTGGNDLIYSSRKKILSAQSVTVTSLRRKAIISDYKERL